MRLVGNLVALHADVAHASGGHQVEDTVDHAKARTQDGHDGEFLAGELFERGGSDGGLDLDVFHRQVAHGLVAVKSASSRTSWRNWLVPVFLSRRIDSLC